MMSDIKHHLDMNDILRIKMESFLSGIAPTPDRIVETAGGGVDAYFFASNSRRFVCIGIDEDAEITILFSDRDQQISDVEDVTPAEPLYSRILQFLNGVL